MNTSTKEIENAIARLCEITGQANNKEEAIKLGFKSYVTYENAPVYGGYRLISIQVDNGGHWGAFGLSSTKGRLPKGQFANMLWAMVSMADYIKNDIR